MNRTKLTTIAHADHLFFNPISSQKVDRILGLLEVTAGSRVLDVGCGKGEMLVRLIERFGVSALGVDPNGSFLGEARARAAERLGPAATRLELREEEISRATIEARSFDAGLCVGSTHAFGDYDDTLRALRRAVRPGGTILVGEGYWKRDPDPGYLSVLGASPGEFTDHAGNVARGAAQGLVPLYSATSSDEEWDEYEGLYVRAVELYAERHPADPDSEAMRQRIRLWRDAYLRWGRTTLGFALYLFRT